MRHESRKYGVVTLIVAVLVAAAMTTSAGAQTPAKKPAAKPAAKPDAKPDAVKTRKKPRGRLPAYFGKVVTQKQREEIYQLQAKYSEQIDKLQKELAQLTAKRDSDVQGVLTPEQKTEIEQLRRNRRSRSSAARSSKPAAKEATKG